MLLLKTLAACLAAAALLAVLQWAGVGPHGRNGGTPCDEHDGCRFCPSAGACISAGTARPTRTNQEERS